MKASTTAALLALLAYAATARYVGNAYPFSTFPMYAQPSESGSRVVLRTADGAVHEVESFTRYAWAEASVPELSPARCSKHPPFYWVPYLDRDVTNWLSANRAEKNEGGEPVTLVRRIWRFAEGRTTSEDCELVSGWAVRR